MNVGTGWQYGFVEKYCQPVPCYKGVEFVRLDWRKV